MTARAVIFGCSGPRLTPDEVAFFKDANPFGFIVFARNIETPDQLRALTEQMRETVGRAAPVLIDQEGGRVARLRPPHWRALPPPLHDPSDEATELRFRLIAADLAAVGVTVDCAPILDVPQPGADDVIGDRALGRDAETVISRGHAARRGLAQGGVLPVIKHIPGHGRAEADTHAALPVVTADRAALEIDFAPFRAHADALMGMTAHMVFQALDPDAPATLSPRVIDFIRRDIGFDGLLMTDDLSMGALSGDATTRATGALDAGCDVILHCNGEMAEMAALAAAIPHLSGAAAHRAAAVDAAIISAPDAAAPFDAIPFDAEAAAARFLELTGGAAHA